MDNSEYVSILIELVKIDSRKDKCEVLKKYIFKENQCENNGLIEELIRLFDQLECKIQ